MKNASIHERIDTLLEQSMQLDRSEPDEAMRLTKRAQALVQQTVDMGAPYLLGQANVNSSLCWLYQDRGDYAQALISGMTALTLFEQLPNKRYLPHLLGSLGITHARLGDIDKGMAYFFRQLEEAEPVDDQWNIARAHLGLGHVYSRIGEYELANQHELLSLQLYRALGDIERQATVLNNLSYSSILAKNFEEALALGLEGIALDPRGELVGSIYVYLHSNIYQAYLGLGNVEAATAYSERAYELAMTKPDRFLQTMIMMDQGRLAIHLADTETAIKWFKQAVELSEQSSTINQFVREGHKELSHLYAQTGDATRALFHFEQFHLAAVKTIRHESIIKLQSVEARHKVESTQKEAEILRLQTVELQQRVDEQTAQLRNSLGRETQLAKHLRQALARADMVAQLKSRVIKVVSHEFRTPMTVISSTSCLIGKHFEQMPAEKRLRQVENMQHAVGKLASLVGEIEEVAEANSANLAPTLETVVLGNLCLQIGKQLESTSTHPERLCVQSISMNDQRLIDIDADMVGKIAHALVSNALKFSDDDVDVAISAESNSLSIAVSDTGIGVPNGEEAQIFELLERGSNIGTIRGLGVGLYLAQQFAMLLGGHIRLESSEIGRGAQFVAEIPLQCVREPDGQNHAE